MSKHILEKASKSIRNLRRFNFSLFLIISIALLLYSASSGFIGIISFFSIFSISIVFFILYLTLSKKLNQIILDGLMALIISFHFIIVFLGFLFFEEAVLMNYNISKISLSLIPFFLNNILGITRTIILLGVLVLIGALAFQSTRKHFFKYPTKISGKVTIIIITISILTFSGLTSGFADEIYNPYNVILSSLDHSVKIPLNTASQNPNHLAQKSHNDNFDSYNINDKKYQYSFVFVMEQTSLEDFYREKDLIKTEDFFKKVKNETHFFKNYYTSNQDSRTAVWEMLSSFFIPIESYIEPWQEYYGYILETNNLINYLKKNGVEPYSVSSVGGGSLILGIYPFNEFIRMYDYDNEQEGYLCSTQFSYQKACEDFAILDKLKEHIIKNKEKDLFYFQEMIFGHGESYMQISGKKRVEYFNDYFNAFYSFLEDEGILNKSIIIIVADHGPKGGAPRKPEDFNIPLMIIAEDLTYLEIEEYYSHLSFKDIFLSYYLGKPLPTSEEIIYLIDQSGRQKRGYIDTKNNYSILGDLSNEVLYLREELSPDIKIEEVKKKIEELLAYEKYVNKLSVENHTYKYIP